MQVRDIRRHPRIEIRRERTLRRVEERPVEVSFVAHMGEE
jgi:hypothetical protein